jgi:[ribosomal protein S5]-alanine N-acetyltransferase
VLPNNLASSRLAMRKPRREDAIQIFRSYGQDTEVSRYLVWRPHTDVAQAEAFIEECIQSWSNERRAYVLTRHGDDTPMGMLDARALGHMVDIGYVLAREHWGQGFMPEAIATLVDSLFAQPAVFRVQATCDVDNTASRRTLEKAGFSREGRLEAYIVLPNISAKPRPCYMYAKCRGMSVPPSFAG